MSNAIILQSEDVLVIEHETASIVETEVQTVLTVESPEYGIVETEVKTVLLVESEIAILVETEVETVLVVQDTEVIVLEATEQGPPGPPGPVGGATVAGMTGLIYTLNKLARVDLPDGTHKTLTYTGDVLNRVDHVKTGQTVRKDLVYVSGRLESVEVSIL